MSCPDYRNIVLCATNKRPQRIPLYEHFIDISVIEKIQGKELKNFYDNGDSQDLDYYFENYCGFFKEFGYDAVSYEVCLTDVLPYGGALTNQSKGKIVDFDSFNQYPWESVVERYIEYAAPYFSALRQHLPEGMKGIGGIGNGIFEVAQDLVGYENLCIISIESPKLYQAVFQKVGDLLFELWLWFLNNFQDVYCVCRFGDDLGYKSNTLLPPADIRRHIIPQYRRIVKLVHQHQKPFLLHSCGCIFSVMDDLIDEVKIDAKHSNEDQIAPMEQWVQSYGNKIGNFGGIDTDILVRGEEDFLVDYVKKIYELANIKGGGFAIGSGNSIPYFVDVKK